MAPATSVFVGGGTPTLVPAGGLADVLRAIPLAAGAEVTVECNPDDVTVGLVETYAAAGVNRVSIGVQSMVPHVLASLGRTHDPANVERAVAAVRRRRAADVQPRHHLRRGRRVARRLAHDAAAHARARAAPRLGVRAHRRGRDGARRRPGAASRRRRPGRRVRAGRRPAGCGRPGQLRGVELGPARPRVPAQPPVLAPARLPRVRLRRPLAPGRSPLVEPAHARSATSPPCGTLGRPRRRGSRSTPTPAASRASSCRCARRPVCRSTALDGDELPGVVERDGDRWVLTRRGRLMANAVSVRLR